jgi:hypothetical protein
MRQRIDLAGLWQVALRQVVAERGAAPTEVARACPFVLDELLANDADPVRLTGKIGPSRQSNKRGNV